MLRALVFLGLLWPASLFADTVTAVLEPSRFAELRTTVNGRISDLLAREGGKVTEGEILASVDAAVQVARVQLFEVIAEADGAKARAEQLLEQTKTRQERIQSAFDKGAAQEWETRAAAQAVAVAEADLQVALDDLDRRKAELALEAATLDEFRLVAPFDATILEVFVENGETVDTDSIIMAVGTLSTLAATAFVPVEWLDAISVDDSLSATLDDGASVDALVAAIDPRMDPASRTVRITLEIANPDANYLVGTALTVAAP
jgi:RND family efflux transporter MFP subunit